MLSLRPSLALSLLMAASACAEATTEGALDGGAAAAGPDASGEAVGSRDASVPISPAAADAGVVVTSHVDGGDACNEADIQFMSKVPSVFILVDRSSSMFERNLWEPLKGGILAIVQELEQDVRFGFSSYTGQAGGMCPDLTNKVAVQTGNFAAIKAAYDSVKPPTYKGETPTSRALDEAAKLLASEPADAPKFIVLVTDGEPDFCDDANVTCSRDAVVASAQAAKKMGIGTFMFSVGGGVDPAHLQDVANAGAGLPVQDRQMAVHYQCGGGKAQYSESAGSAPFYEPNVNDQKALVASLSTAVASARSCVFELAGKVQIDPNAADQGTVLIDAERVPYGAPDGYRMNSPTQLELLGKACATLRRPETKNISIDFPCTAIVLL